MHAFRPQISIGVNASVAAGYRLLKLACVLVLLNIEASALNLAAKLRD